MLKQYKTEFKDKLVDIFYDVYHSKPFEYEWIDRDSIFSYFSDIEYTPNFCGFVLACENKIVGGCLGIINDYFKNSKYRISEIFIDRKYQGRGLGRGFIEDIERELRNKCIDIVELNTENSIPAYNFYKKSGYIPSNNMTYMIKSIKN